MPNPYETVARIKKVNALLEYLISIEATVKGVEQLAPEEWGLVAGAAGVRKPSGETVRLVVESIRRMEGRRDA